MNLKHYLREHLPYAWRIKIEQYLPGVWTNGISKILSCMDKKITTAFDIGANVGDISLYLLYYFPKLEVYSFEPCLDTYNHLVENIKKAGYSDRSHSYRLGFFDNEYDGKLNVTSFHGANSMIGISEEYHKANPHIEYVKTENIPLMRLDDFVKQNQIRHIDFLKIDVEGVEKQVLIGGKETFSNRVDTVIMEISLVRHTRESGEFIQLFQLMHEYGFYPCQIFDLYQNNFELAQFDCVFRRYK